VNVYSAKNEYRKAVEYALLVVKVRREGLRTSPNTPAVAHKFCSAACKAGVALANAGQFKLSEIHYKEALKVYADIDATSQPAYICLEYYTNALHQQAKTHEAVAKLEEYKKKIINLQKHLQCSLLQGECNSQSTSKMIIID